MRQYEDNQYYETPNSEQGFTNYERLLVELNSKEYYDKSTYCKLLNENGLNADDIYNKNIDHAQLLETAYAVLYTLYNNIDLFRKIETEFVTQSEAATALQNRLTNLRKEIDRVKLDMKYKESDFTFMFYGR